MNPFREKVAFPIDKDVNCESRITGKTENVNIRGLKRHVYMRFERSSLSSAPSAALIIII